MSSDRIRASRVSFTRLDADGRSVGDPVVVDGECDVTIEDGGDRPVELVCFCPRVGVHRVVDGAWSVSREVMHSRDCAVGGSVDGVSPGASLHRMPPGAASCLDADHE